MGKLQLQSQKQNIQKLVNKMSQSILWNFRIPDIQDTLYIRRTYIFHFSASSWMTSLKGQTSPDNS